MLSTLFNYGRSTVNAIEPWEAKAIAKRASNLAKIPKEWRLRDDDLKKAENQRNLTDSFIEQYLNEQEIYIIREGSVNLVEKIQQGNLSAAQVTQAFCKTAAIAHQIVRFPIPLHLSANTYNIVLIS